MSDHERLQRKLRNLQSRALRAHAKAVPVNWTEKLLDYLRSKLALARAGGRRPLPTLWRP
ncbi:hypothetical protein PZN02_006298 (plasmid) [Sinorhizobium garamanticum]|uniref:Transposase n=1 Tax=Sinorhizobium garamanticum TaxID=680247 RepID=A0ABY8DPI8_9HYPH|nr:hypothetical protein [Sinorhizobium garamanticum]WEX91495.1 hypothetical protein PZN02_006298 [Sinorhizobium garamanticum]